MKRLIEMHTDVFSGTSEPGRHGRPCAVRLAAVISLIAVLAFAIGACGSSSGSSTGSESTGSSESPESGSGESSGSSGDGAESNGEPLTIGFAMGFSGFAAAFDMPVYNGAQVAIKELNEKGGIDGREIKTVKADTHSELSQVPSAAQTVIDEGAEVVIPTCDYDYGGPAARVAVQEGLLSIGCAGSPLYGKQGIGATFFNVEDTTPNEGGVMATYAMEQGWKSAYVFEDTSIEYTKSGCKYFKEAYAHEGGSIAGEDTFENEDSSIGAQISRMEGTSADVIIMCSYIPGVTSAVKQIRAASIDIPILGQLGADGRVISGGTPNLSNFFYLSRGSIHGEEADKEKINLGKQYQAMFGNLSETPDAQPQFGYAAIQTVAKAMEETGGNSEGQALAEKIQEFTNVPLITGPTTYTAECHTPQEREISILKVEEGKVEVASKGIVPNYVPPAPC